MKITVTFDSLEEFHQHMGTQAADFAFKLCPAPISDGNPVEPNIGPGAATPEELPCDPSPAAEEDETPTQEPQEAPQPPATPDPKPSTPRGKKTEKPAPEPAQDTKDETKGEPIDEKYRIKVRKQLAALNRKRGYNRAAELIEQQTGKDKLTEVELADLPKLMATAEEELNAE